jgi:AcrR family transcriptional regulator
MKEKSELDTRYVLLQTAARLFAEHGFEAVSTRLLAKEAGVNIAMIAYYFGSKEKLFEAIIDEHIPKTRETLIGFLNLNISSWDKFSFAIDNYVDKMFQNGSFTKLLYRELSLQQRPDHSERIMDAIMRNWDVMNQIILEGQNNGSFKKDIDTIMTMTSVFGTILQIVNTPSLAARAMSESDATSVFSEENRLRLKIHLRQLMKAHIMISPS